MKDEGFGNVFERVVDIGIVSEVTSHIGDIIADLPFAAYI